MIWQSPPLMGVISKLVFRMCLTAFLGAPSSLQPVWVPRGLPLFTSAGFGSQGPAFIYSSQFWFPGACLYVLQPVLVPRGLPLFTPASFGSQGPAFIHFGRFWFPGACPYLLQPVLVPRGLLLFTPACLRFDLYFP
jgi:hypothetical protein